MSVRSRVPKASFIERAILLMGLLILAANALAAETPGPEGGAAQTPHDPSRPAPICEPAAMGSPYIPLDSWMYPAIMRLYGLGFIDTVYLGMRPWTRGSAERMVEEAGARIEDSRDYVNPTTDEAESLYDALRHELDKDMVGPCNVLRGKARAESAYTVMRGISGTPIRDSFHLGQSIVNDYGRPYANGFNSYSGASGYVSAGRYTLYARGEFQAAPSAAGYSSDLAQTLSVNVDIIPFIDPTTNLPYNQATIPRGPIAFTTYGRWMELYASALVLNHEISFGKQDNWLGPGVGGAMAYSNNADNIYSFRINRIEPLRIPWLSYVTGPFRYDFMVGPLQGHVYPNSPWVHAEQISFRPTTNLEFGFERTVIWGGKDHVPITLHTFLRSFFSFSAPTAEVKFSRDDPGARFGAFNFSYRLPFLRNWLTLYADAEVHDDISPIDAPRRAAWRPGLYLSHFPGLPKLDMRAEAAYTDPPVSTSNGGHFMYWEGVQRQGYTNKGMLFGDWIGREAKGGQGWITYHLSGNEWIQAGVRNHKTAKDFIPGSATELDPATGRLIEGGTTMNDINFQVVKRIGESFEVNGNFDYGQWKAPIYLPGRHTVTTTTIQLTWYPDRKVSF
jgi:Capsule assembly protein Wzi